ncbi:MAG: enoyl-CoA hydratase/isomerase family protein [Deltaproteobacteria bacterium]|nr:enoyl-CoA hydratase/isomerase family protein [Deltaproteobacteria bacterium]
MTGQVRTSIKDGIGTLVFDHEARRNAITGEMWDAIPAAVETLEKSDEVRVVVMRGAGDVAFVSGADISQFEQSRSGASAAEYDLRNARAFTALAEMKKPLIALIHGFCVGGGCAIALTADLRYCAEDGVFAIPAAKLGLGYHVGGLEALVSVVGQAAAREIFFTARRLRADEALRMGLVNAVLPKHELESHVLEVAQGIAKNAPLTLASAKFILGQIRRAPQSRDRESMDASIRACYESADYAEGVRAFLEKRPAAFEGR